MATDLEGAVIASRVGVDGALYLVLGTSHSLAAGERIWWASADAAGRVRFGRPIELDRDAFGVELAPDGTAYLRRYATDPRPCSESSQSMGYTITGSEIVAFGESGTLPGWPFASPDVLSRPASAPDGTIYVTAGRVVSAPENEWDVSGSPPSRIVALDHTGRARTGWPALLAFAAVYGGYSGESSLECPSELLFVVPPIVAADGSVFVIGRLDIGGLKGTTLLAAFRPDGSQESTGTYEVSARISSGCYGVRNVACWASVQPVVTADGRLYAAIGPTGTRDEGYLDKVLAMDLHGRVRGWPVTLTTRNGATTGLAVRPAGGVIVGRASADETFVVGLDEAGKAVFRTTLTNLAPGLRRDSVVNVATDDLAVWSGPGREYRLAGRLARGEQAFVLRWARGWVLVQAAGRDRVWGWVPITAPNGSASIVAAATDCPLPPYDLPSVAGLAPEERLACFGDRSISFDVPVVRTTHGESLLFNDPNWLLDPAYYCRLGADQDGPWVDATTDPESGLSWCPEPTPGRGFRVTGHFDDPAARTCLSHQEDMSSGQETYMPRIEAVFRCRAQFVVTAREEIDLP